MKEKLEQITEKDFECVFHKILESNISNNIETNYSKSLRLNCKDCDGYNPNCGHYMLLDDYSMFEEKWK